jgi:hypothetical protein
MKAADALAVARQAGVDVRIEGQNLRLRSGGEPPPDVLETLRLHKAEIVALLATDHDAWTAKDWQVFYDGRAGIAEYDGGVSRAETEVRAFEWCINEWMEQHPEPSLPDQCAWCGKPDTTGSSVVPFGTQSHGHTWLHSGCWEVWFRDRRERAEQALRAFGVERPNHQVDS